MTLVGGTVHAVLDLLALAWYASMHARTQYGLNENDKMTGFAALANNV